MKSILHRETGDPSVPELVERAAPEPGAGEVRVPMAVSGVNPTDWKSRSGATVITTVDGPAEARPADVHPL